MILQIHGQAVQIKKYLKKTIYFNTVLILPKTKRKMAKKWKKQQTANSLKSTQFSVSFLIRTSGKEYHSQAGSTFLKQSVHYWRLWCFPGRLHTHRHTVIFLSMIRKYPLAMDILVNIPNMQNWLNLQSKQEMQNIQNMQKQTNKIKPIKPNLPNLTNQTYQTKPNQT